MDFSNNPNLAYLTCESNNLSSLNVTNCPKLYRLECSYNEQLTKLSVSYNPLLSELRCICPITTLNIAKNPLLIKVYQNALPQDNGSMISYQMYDKGNALLLWVSPNTAVKTVTVSEFVKDKRGRMAYYENGEFVPDKFGFVDFSGSKFIVANGFLVQDKTGLVQDPDNGDDWYFCVNGQVATKKTGLVQYPAKTDNWFIVVDGRLDTTYSGFVSYNGGLFFVARGKLVRKTGLVQDPNNKANWYFIVNGQVQSKKTGIVLYNGAGFYVEQGKLKSDFTGTITVDGKTYHIVNGRVK